MSNFQDFEIAYPQHEEAVTLVFNDTFPIKNIFIGMTLPFSSYSIHRTEKSKHHLFEYILQGKGEIVINGEKFPLQSGDTFVLDKGSTHNFHSDKNDPLKKIWLNLQSDYIDKMLTEYRVQAGVYRANVQNNFLAIYNIARTDATPQNKFFTIADNLHAIITALSRSTLFANNSPVGTIKNELLAAVYTKRTLDDIAAKLFMSRSNLIRIFKKHTGITPYAFLMQEKLNVAQTLLSSTDITVKAISELLCFTDEHYFCFLFKQKTGVTPTQYRNR